GKRSLEAVAAFHDFLDGHAGSPRAGQASAMLGWLLIDARVFDEADRRFQAAAGDPDPAVRRRAQARLDAPAGRTRAARQLTWRCGRSRLNRGTTQATRTELSCYPVMYPRDYRTTNRQCQADSLKRCKVLPSVTTLTMT